jgi:hypothetical protein
VNWAISKQHMPALPRCGERGEIFSQKYLTISQKFENLVLYIVVLNIYLVLDLFASKLLHDGRRSSSNHALLYLVYMHIINYFNKCIYSEFCSRL